MCWPPWLEVRFGSSGLLDESMFVGFAEELLKAGMVRLEVQVARSYCWSPIASATTQLTMPGRRSRWRGQGMSSRAACPGSLTSNSIQWISSVGTTVDRPAEQSKRRSPC